MLLSLVIFQDFAEINDSYFVFRNEIQDSPRPIDVGSFVHGGGSLPLLELGLTGGSDVDSSVVAHEEILNVSNFSNNSACSIMSQTLQDVSSVTHFLAEVKTLRKHSRSFLSLGSRLPARAGAFVMGSMMNDPFSIEENLSASLEARVNGYEAALKRKERPEGPAGWSYREALNSPLVIELECRIQALEKDIQQLLAEVENRKTYRRNEKFKSFEECREYARSLGLKTCKEWEKWMKIDRPEWMPASPYQVFKDQWQGWKDWLGND